MPGPRVALLLRTLDQAYDRKSWHGTTLRGSLRQVTAEEASWRPAPGRHNIWEIAVHAAYWKYVILRRIRRAGRGSFPLEGSNWFERPVDASERAWREDLSLLGRIHRELRDAVAGVADADLDTAPEGTTTPFSELIVGGAFHDIYHAGQIQLLKRLRAEG